MLNFVSDLQEEVNVRPDINKDTKVDTIVDTSAKRIRNNTMSNKKNSDIFNKTNDWMSKRYGKTDSKGQSSSATKVTYNMKASFMESQSIAKDKLIKRNQSKLVDKTIKATRQTALPFKATVTKDKKENIKTLRVTLGHILPNANKVNGIGSPKSVLQSDSISVLKDKLNINHNNINGKSTEAIKKLHEGIGKDVPTNDNIMLNNDKNIFVSTETQMESSIQNVSQAFPQSADQNTSEELRLKSENLLNNSVEKHENVNNKENLTENVINDLSSTKDTISNTSQSSKFLSESNTNKNELIKEKCKSPCNFTLKCYSNLVDDVSMKEASNNSNAANSSMNESIDLSVDVENTSSSDNMQKLVIELDSSSEIPLAENLNRNALEVHTKKNNGNVNMMDVTVSNVERINNTNDHSKIDSITMNTIKDDKCDIKEETEDNKLHTSESVQKSDEIDHVKIISFPNLRNIVLLKSPNEIVITNILPSDTNTVLKTSNTHTSPKKAIFTNRNEDDLTNILNNNQSSIDMETSTELIEKMPQKEELLKKVSELNDSSISKKLCVEKLQSNEQKAESVKKIYKQSQESTHTDDNDVHINVESLFQNIPADEWKEKVASADKNSVYSVSTKRLGNESEVECDLILVDKISLTAENVKVNKEKEIFNYSSDDTVIVSDDTTVLLKMQKDCSKAQKDEQMVMDISENNCKMNVSKDAVSNKNNELRSPQNKENESEEDVTGNVENAKSVTQDAKNSNSVNQNKSMIKDSNEYCTSECTILIQQSTGKESLSESHKTTKIQANFSLNESELCEDFTPKRKFLNKSIHEIDDKLEKSNKVEIIRKRSSTNESNYKQNEISEDELSNESVIITSTEANEQEQSLNSPLKKNVKLKHLDVNKRSSNELKQFEIHEKHNNSMKKKDNRNYSTLSNIISYSDESQCNSDDSQNKTIELPKFLLSQASSIDSEGDGESIESIDSHIQQEYNLHDKDVFEFPDDDISGDKCIALKKESSHQSGNRLLLTDFTVDDVKVKEQGKETENDKYVEMEIIEKESELKIVKSKFKSQDTKINKIKAQKIIPLESLKKRKFSKIEEQILPSRSMFNLKTTKIKNIHVESIQKESKIKHKKSDFKNQGTKTNKIEAQKKYIKRLSDKVIENLSDIPLKPLKKRKFLKIEEQILPSRSMFDSRITKVKIAHEKKLKKENKLQNTKSEFKMQGIKFNKIKTQEEGIKRFSDEVLENLSDVSLKSMKKRKFSKMESQIHPSRSMFGLKCAEAKNVHVKEVQKKSKRKYEESDFKKQRTKTNKIEPLKKSIKRFPDEVLENLSDIPLEPLKKRKFSKIEEEILPSRSMFDLKPKKVKNLYTKEDSISLSCCGSTTPFIVVNLEKIKKKKNVRKIVLFKQKM